MTLFHDRFRIESSRMPGKDYADPGMYFVTMCTRGRVRWFGEIRHGIMGLSDVGCIVAQEIQRTQMVRSNVQLDAWIVMPDHIHIMVELLPNVSGDIVETCRRHVSTRVAIIIPLCRPRPSSVGSIVNHIKSISTKRIWSMGYRDFAWQPRFHDSILRTGHAVDAVRAYIRRNPVVWDDHEW